MKGTQSKRTRPGINTEQGQTPPPIYARTTRAIHHFLLLTCNSSAFFWRRNRLPLTLNGEILNFHSLLIIDPPYTKYQSTFPSRFNL